MVRIYDEYEGYLNGPSFSSPRKNLGNKLFIYATHYLLAQHLDCSLIIPERPLIQRNGVEEVFPFKSVYRDDVQQSTEGYTTKEQLPQNWLHAQAVVSLGSIEAVAEAYRGFEIVSNAEFSRYDLIKPYKDIIKTLYKGLTGQKRESNDLVMLLRSSNYDRSFVLPDSYYLNILEREAFDKLYVSFDHYENHAGLFAKLEKYNPILLDLNILDLFKEVTTFPKIICSQGTFSFWTALLSQADKIYWPITTSGPNRLGDQGVNLYVDDEPRYEFINIPDIHTA